MYRKGDEMQPPWTDPTAAAWRIYAQDFLYGLGRPREKDYLRALRYAVGLTRRPKLVLVSCLPNADLASMSLVRNTPHWNTAFFHGLRWWTPDWADRKLDSRYTNDRCTPLDFPGMTDPDNPVGLRLCHEFIWKATAITGTLKIKDGAVVEVVVCGKWKVINQPLRWEVECAAR